MSSLYDALKASGGKFEDFRMYLTEKAKLEKNLISAIIQLTPLCNLNCKMCYARMDKADVEKKGKHIMGFDEWKFYLDALNEMGVSQISFTGGECTIHPDFVKIYSYAYDLGYSISIMTNLSHITDEIFQLFVSKPPFGISFTVYGSSEETYEKLCKNKNAYKATYDNFEKFNSMGYNILPKMTVVKDNIYDYEEIEEYFRKKGLRLVESSLLVAFDNCEKDSLDNIAVDNLEWYNIRKKVYSKVRNINEEDSIDRKCELIEASCSMPEKDGNTKEGLKCSGGRSSCYINWEGMMTPCVTIDVFTVDPRKVGFEKAWEETVHWADRVPALDECEDCLLKTECNSCASIHYGDTGVFGKVSERLCLKKKFPEEVAKIEAKLAERGILT